MSNKRRRTSTWSALSKVFHANTLAEQLDNQSELVEEKDKRIAVLRELLAKKNSEAYQNSEEWETHCSTLQKTLKDTEEDRNNLRMTIGSKNKEIQQLQAKNDVLELCLKEKDDEFVKLKQTLVAIQKQLEEKKKESESYKQRLDDLHKKAADALAMQTINKFGVTPEEVAKFKVFATKQAEAAAAQKAMMEAAKAATTYSLTDK